MAKAAGGAGGGGIAAGVEQGEQTIPVEDFFSEVKVTSKAKPLVEAAWGVMDDEDRQTLIDSYSGTTIRYMSGKNEPNGDTRFTAIASAYTGAYVDVKPKGETRIHKRLLDRSPQAVAGTLLHEAAHVGGKGQKFSGQERWATRKSQDFQEKGYRRAMARGDNKAAQNHLDAALNSSIYRGAVIGTNEPLTQRYSKSGFGGSKRAGTAMWDAAQTGDGMASRYRVNREQEQRFVNYDGGLRGKTV